MNYNEKEVNKLAKKITDYIGKQFAKTENLGVANQFIAFADVYCATLTLFFCSLNDEEGIRGLIDIMHEQEESAVNISKIINWESKKLN